MINKIKIQNFRCFQNVEVTLRNFNVLIGPNDSGKTSFLEVFEKLQKTASLTLSSVFGNKLLSHVWRHDEKNVIQFALEFDSQLSYQMNIQYKYQKSNPVIEFFQYTHEELKNSEQSFLNPKQSPNTGISQLQLSNQKNDEEQIALIKETSSFLINIKNHNFDLEKIRQSSKPQHVKAGIDPDGGRLAAYLAALKLEKLKLFTQIVEALQKEIPRIQDVNLVLNEKQEYELFFFNSDTQIDVSARDTSDGVLIFLAYLALLYSPHDSISPSMILLEEPENGVHPKRLEAIVKYLKKLSQTQKNGVAPQIILTTHSPYLLDYVEAEDVLVFCRSKENGGANITRLSDIPQFKEKKGDLYLGEMWTAFGEEFLMEKLNESHH